ncbi:MAG: exodeoxyribonuclease VII large subunit [Planctomycetaceae bacterium]|nr:exodeoxyribonuclease VII large subunit [Planctomycetaceae bacterium]
MAKPARQLPAYSVSQLNGLIKGVLEGSLPGRMILRGEISDWKRHSSGHCYFLLKDAESQMPCLMWASRAREVKFRCENGLEVLATGYVDVYVPGGKYQFYADRLDPAGVGALQLAFEQMRRRLEAEGLFDPAHKKPLPRYAMRIGVVTSRSGAAIEDIRNSISSRWPCAKLFLFDVPVQGEGAAEKIAAAIKKANAQRQRMGLELLIVGRGGGSMEDLWAFNEEVVARAIYASALPVISAVGHEVDVTISDLVADARASTPTRAGEIAVPDYREELKHLQAISHRLHINICSVFQNRCGRLETILASRVFRSPLGPLQAAAQRIDELCLRLGHGQRSRFAQLKAFLEQLRHSVQRIEPMRVLGLRQMELMNLVSRGRAAMASILNKKQLQSAALENRLQAMNPRSVLKRGYSLTVNQRSGKVVAGVDDVRVGDRLTTELADGAQVTSLTESLRKAESMEA